MSSPSRRSVRARTLSRFAYKLESEFLRLRARRLPDRMTGSMKRHLRKERRRAQLRLAEEQANGVLVASWAR